MITQLAAIISVVILTALFIFQVLLIFGVPLGNYAWGGSHKVLPTKLRVGSFISLFIYTFFAFIILDKASLVSVFSGSGVRDFGIYFLIGYFALGIFMNGISRSLAERRVMTPTVAVLFILSLVVATNV